MSYQWNRWNRLLQSKSPFKRLVSRRLVQATCLVSILILSSCQFLDNTDNPTKNPGTNPDHKHIIGVEFTGTGDGGVWPPQALGATNVTAVRNYSGGLSMQTLASSFVVKERFDKHSGLNSIRGSRYASFEIDIVDEKDVAGKDTEGVYARTTYYNYVSDLTIDAWIDSNDSIQYKVQPAYTTQPPENREEEAEAVRLAKADLLSKGFGDVNNLKGTAMLAFPSEDDVAATGNGFYSQRILYATFGQGDGQVPVYKALVNLSQSTVSDSGRVASY